MISTIVTRFKKWRDKCRSCNVDGIHQELIGHYKNLRPIQRVKTVDEYKCDRCGTLWVLADKSQFLDKVFRNELYEQWKSQPWLPNATQTLALNSIIGAACYYGSDVYFPCKIKLQNGQLFQKAIVCATTGARFGKFSADHDVSLLDEGYELFPSDYALSADIRATSMVARERKMAYAPTNVKDHKGKRYTLTGQVHFFEVYGVCGPSVVFDDSPYHGKNRVNPNWAEMYLICDMFDCAVAAPLKGKD